jgi:hypothetical protein
MCGWSFCLRTNLLRPLSNGCEQCLAEAAAGGYRLENVFRASAANSKYNTRARGRKAFGLFRTLELRISARIRQIDEMPISLLKCGVTQIYFEIA